MMAERFSIHTISAAAGVFFAGIAEIFGGFDNGMKTLIICMVIDLITGGIILPIVFNKSPKTENGGIESKAFWKGLCRKGISLTIVMIATRLDMMFPGCMIRDAVIIAFITNDIISIVENAGLMGIPMPKKITETIEVLKERSGE